MSNRRNAWLIIGDAEKAAGVMSMAEARAAYGGFDQPRAPEDYLMWIKDEIVAQESQLDQTEEQDAKVYLSYIRLLRGVVTELEELGVAASPEPWAVPA